jgi:anaerobic magnesium-protoporphyrin IX monomethyl ester cyclase
MKILIIQPQVRESSPPQDIPVGLLMIAAIARDAGHKVSFLDLNAYRVSLQTAGEEIAIDDYEIICIGGLSSMYKDIKKILPLCKIIHPDSLLVAGGGFITYMPDKILQLQPEIDVAVLGEGEETWKEILDAGPNGDFSKIKGIVYRSDNDGGITFTEPRPLISDMDVLPYPAYEFIDIDRYSENYELVNSEEAFTAKRKLHIVTERGCPRQCTFCTHNGMSRWDQIVAIGKDKVKEMDKDFGFQQIARFNSPRYVIDHMKFLHEKYNVSYIFLADENLTSNRKRTHELCDLMIKEGLPDKIKWGTGGDSASVDDKLVQHMKQAGCTFITFGGESGSDKVLKYDIQKGTTRQHNFDAVNVMKRQKMEPIMTFMMGNPNENIDDILETTDFFIKTNLLCDPFICTPFPGTRLFLDYEEQILAQVDERLAQVKELPEGAIDPGLVKQWKLDALGKFLVSLDDADKLSVHVSQVFDYSDLLGIKNLMFNHDIPRLLKLAHIRNWTHDAKWNKQCPVCEAKTELSQFTPLVT